MSSCSLENKTQHPLLQKLYPTVELTPQLRPCALFAARTLIAVPIIACVLHHQQRDAYQFRVSFQAHGQPPLFRRSPWKVSTPAESPAVVQEMLWQHFATMVTELGGEAPLRLAFASTASNDEILQAILASQIPELLGERE